jgi:hypothetical protein
VLDNNTRIVRTDRRSDHGAPASGADDLPIIKPGRLGEERHPMQQPGSKEQPVSKKQAG